jgi:hypothetical protein
MEVDTQTTGIRLIDGRRMRCADVPDEVVFDAIRNSCIEQRCALTVHVQRALEQVLGPVPWNLLLAKLRKLLKAGKIDGCACGCRGDFTVRNE